MFGYVSIEGKIFEFFGGGGGAFPFRVTKFSGRKQFLLNLSLEKFHWSTVKWVQFCSSKRDPLSVRTFRLNNRCWLLQLRKNINRRFVILIHYISSGR